MGNLTDQRRCGSVERLSEMTSTGFVSHACRAEWFVVLPLPAPLFAGLDSKARYVLQVGGWDCDSTISAFSIVFGARKNPRNIGNPIKIYDWAA